MNELIYVLVGVLIVSHIIIAWKLYRLEQRLERLGNATITLARQVGIASGQIEVICKSLADEKALDELMLMSDYWGKAEKIDSD